MKAIIKREFRGYFTSMLGYTFLAIFLLLSGVMFVTNNLSQGRTSMNDYFISMLSWAIFILPILTMRMFSEDKKQRTDQLLLTSPISITEMVVGKFLAAVSAFGISLAVTLLYPLMMSFYSSVPFAETVSLYAGFILFCSMIISIGSFMSSVTENQIVAAISTYGVIILLMFLDMLTSIVSNPVISKILLWISPFERFTDFTIGILNMEPIIYYISMTAVFLFLAVRVFEKKRWS
ncbi:MAG: ABC transporter permease subunit [Oscillospiraceae bacterium]|nr:ABC transporter permease subunit [Oscillospiraceae bacterium]